MQVVKIFKMLALARKQALMLDSLRDGGLAEAGAGPAPELPEHFKLEIDDCPGPPGAVKRP